MSGDTKILRLRVTEKDRQIEQLQRLLRECRKELRECREELGNKCMELVPLRNIKRAALELLESGAQIPDSPEYRLLSRLLKPTRQKRSEPEEREQELLQECAGEHSNESEYSAW